MYIYNIYIFMPFIIKKNAYISWFVVSMLDLGNKVIANFGLVD